MKTTAGEKFRLRVPTDARIALAFSGGRDSVALADMLAGAGADFFAVHVEHGIRGKDSLRDADFAREFCRQRGIAFELRRVDAPAFAAEKGLTLEQAARELRYGVFEELLSGGECDFVALAHHADDQTETVLMRILRGTGIRGLRGMSEVSGRYLRPLLSVPRSEIDAYIEAARLPYVEDATNSDESYTRNFLRAELARIKERFPSVNEAVARLVRHASETDDLVESLAPQPLVTGDGARVPLSAFAVSVLAKRTIARACSALGVEQDIEEKHYDAVIALAGSETGKRVELSHGLTAHLEREAVVFTRGEENALPADAEAAFPHGGEAEIFGVKIERVAKDAVFGRDGALYADADKIPADAVLRGRREGDRITKFGGGTKSLGDFLTDRKVPLRLRDSLVVCASGSEVLFVAGVEISERVRVGDDTVNAIKITTTEEKYVR